RSNAIQPELRAIDAYNARERLVEWLREHGVTTIHTGHGPGAIMSGQTMIAKTRGSRVAEADVEPVAMVAMMIGPEGARNFNNRPGTTPKAIGMMRPAFLKAQDYMRPQQQARDGNGPSRDLELEVLAQVLRGEIPA